MNKLSVDPAAEQKYTELTTKYSDSLLAKADIIARQRSGNSIQTGDLEHADIRMNRTDRNSQFLLLVCGSLLGAGIAGIIQSPLDGKPITHLVLFGTIIVVSLIASAITLWRR